MDGVGRGTTGALFVRDFSLLYCIAGKFSLNNTKERGQREEKNNLQDKVLCSSLFADIVR